MRLRSKSNPKEDPEGDWINNTQEKTYDALTDTLVDENPPKKFFLDPLLKKQINNYKKWFRNFISGSEHRIHSRKDIPSSSQELSQHKAKWTNRSITHVWETNNHVEEFTSIGINDPDELWYLLMYLIHKTKRKNRDISNIDILDNWVKTVSQIYTLYSEESKIPCKVKIVFVIWKTERVTKDWERFKFKWEIYTTFIQNKRQLWISE